MFPALTAEAPGVVSEVIRRSTQTVPGYPTACSQMNTAVSMTSRFLGGVQAILGQVCFVLFFVLSPCWAPLDFS